MPVVQKIKSVLSRKNSTPEAPIAPPVTQTTGVAPIAEPINNQTLLNQRENLVHDESLLARDASLNNGSLLNNDAGLLNNTNTMNNGNIYNNLAGNELRNESLLAEESLLANETAYVQSGQRSSLGMVRAEPTVIQTIEKDVVIQERIHPVMKEEIQPILYREREQLDVRQVTQMMHETQVQPTLVEQRELAPEVREAVIERAAPIPENIVLSSREVDPTITTQVVHAPIVEEVIRKTVIEEIQPVIERDVFQPTLIQNTQAIHEKIIEAPTVYREVRQVQELGTRNLGGDSALVEEALLFQNTSSNSYQQRDLVSQELAYESQGLNSQGLNSQGLNSQGLNSGYAGQNNMLATGQVLPQIQSSRPAYAYLPPNYSEPRPQFIGTSSQYVVAANGLQGSLNHSKTLPTVYPMGMNQTAAPMTMNRQ